MSEAIQLCGYGGLPGGANLIREEQAREVGQKSLKPVPTPKFTVQTQPPYCLSRTFDCIKNDDSHYGDYIVRDDQDLAVIVEVPSWDDDGPIFGNAWTLDRRLLQLAAEESATLAQNWRDMMESRAAKDARELAHDGDY